MIKILIGFVLAGIVINTLVSFLFTSMNAMFEGKNNKKVWLCYILPGYVFTGKWIKEHA